MNEAMGKKPSLKAMVVELRLLGTDEDGRKTPILSGYRPNCWFGVWDDTGTEAYNDVQLTFDIAEGIPPGGRAIVHAQPYHPEYIEHLVEVGTEFDVCEGARVVGKATVLEILTE